MWYRKSIDQTLNDLETDPSQGLSSEEVVKRREQYGHNVLPAYKKKSIFLLLWEQLNSLLIYILIAAAIVSAIVGEVSDAVIIIIVVILNAMVGIVQEAKAEKALEALKQMSTPRALVKRDGQVSEIPADQVVPGDIVLIEAGRSIPADLRLIETADLQIEESALTGESVPADKSAAWRSERGKTLGDQKNMAFMSTVATYGRGVGVVTGTAMATEIGKIAKLLGDSAPEQTPLQKRLIELGRLLGSGALITCIIIFFIGYFQGREPVDIFLIAVSLAVAAIPESLPAIVTVVLALGVQRMIKLNAIVRKLPAVETLGSVNVICSDKTGTLTQNKMTVTKVFTGMSIKDAAELNCENPTEKMLLKCLLLCNDATLDGQKQSGDPTEVALLATAYKHGLSKERLELKHVRVGEIPFDSNRKMMTTVHRHAGQYLVITKGAVESIIHRTSKVIKDNIVVELSEKDKLSIMETAEGMAEDALRVLGFAYKQISSLGNNKEDMESELIFLGLVGMIDPPRLEVKDSIARCKKAGIKTVMITGDHKKTAVAIGVELGILTNEKQAVTGAEIDQLTQEQLHERIDDLRILARVSPEHKVKIVKAFKARGNTVAMTGDGVNDAPSLKQADIGIAMGIAGTDVAKGASDMILTDDNFSTIVAAIEEGRNIFNNIKKSVIFLLSCNIGELLVLFLAIVAGWPAPLKATHILWVNLVTDTLPAISLGVDPGDPEVMNQKPRHRGESLFAGGAGIYTLLNGVLIASLTLAAFVIGAVKYSAAGLSFPACLYNMSTGALAHAQTMAFLVLSISQLIHAFNLRHPDKPVLRAGFLDNKYLLGSVLLGIAIQITLACVPRLAQIFKVQSLTPVDWIIITLLSITPVMLNDIIKWLNHARRRQISGKM